MIISYKKKKKKKKKKNLTFNYEKYKVEDFQNSIN